MNTDTIPTVKPISRKKSFNYSSLSIVFISAVLFIFLSISSSTFLTQRNVYSVLYGVSFQFFAIIGFTYLMIMGEIDLSVGSVYAFSGMFVGYMMVMLNFPLVPALVISLLVCTLFGIFTGFLVVKFRLNSMMVTIATMTLIRGLASNFVNGMWGATYPTEMRDLSRAEIGGVYLTIILMIVLIVALEVLLKKSAIFKKLYFVGENRQTTRIYGIRADTIKISMFAVSALAAAVGGILLNARVTYADTAIGSGLEFQLLTAAVLGGASLYGGKGSILGSAIGLIFLAIILNGMVIFNIEPLLQQLIIGIILIVSVFIDTRLNKINKG